MKYTNVTNVDITYNGNNKEIHTINLWLRDGHKKVMREIVQPFFNYFYIPKGNFKELHWLEENGVKYNMSYPEKKSVFGEEVMKIEILNLNKKEFAALKDKFTKTYEFDIKYTNRFLIDNDIEYTKEYRTCFMDIETDMSLDTVNTPEAVTSVALYDNFTKQYIMLMLDQDSEEDVKNERIDGVPLITYRSERDMLQGVINYMKDYQPDILTAYNLNNFDFPYLYNRMALLGLKPMDMATNKRSYNFVSQDGMKLSHMGGMELIDYYDLVVKLYKDDPLENFKLDTVGKAIVNMGKIEYKSAYETIGEMHKFNKGLFIKYNLRDVEILVEIEKKMKLISGFLQSTQKIVGCPLKDIFNNSVSLDFFMLKMFKDEFVFPSKIKREHQKIIGALSGVIADRYNWHAETVAPPYKLYEDMAVIDFAGLYPNLIRTFNLSPEMKTTGKGITIDGVTFAQETRGILPRMVDVLMKLKTQYGDAKHTVDPNSDDFTIVNSIYMGVKGLINSLYGVFVFPGFRMYDHGVGKSITSSARMMLLTAYNHLYDNGYPGLYVDTDSIFFQTKKHDPEEALLEVNAVCVDLNKHLEATVLSGGSNDSYLDMDFEKRFSKVVFMGVKKRYIGLCDIWDGKAIPDNEKFVVKGYDLKRSEIPDTIKVRIKDIIVKSIKGAGVEEIKIIYDSLVDYVLTTDIKNIAWSKGLNKPFHEYKVFASQFKGALTSKKYLGTAYKCGDKPKFFYLKPKLKIRNPITGKDVMSDIIAFDNETTIPPNIESKFDRGTYIKKYVDEKLMPFTKVEEMCIDEVIKNNKLDYKAYGLLMDLANGDK